MRIGANPNRRPSAPSRTGRRHAAAAFAGLQDSAPRAALVALHARVEGAACSDWEHPSLVQSWAPRGAVFVLPRADLEVFAAGSCRATPRGEDVAAADRRHRRAALSPWASLGLVLLDGEVAAAWGQSDRRVTLLALAPPARPQRYDIESEALTMPVAQGIRDVVWRHS